MLECLRRAFPKFTAAFGAQIEEIKPPLTPDDIHQLEDRAGVPLPESFKIFLACTGGFWLDRPHVQFMPLTFFDAPDRLFFADYFKEADGDQVFFDLREDLKDGEYPVFYYCHEDRPPTTWKLADSFAQWLEGLGG